MDRGLEMFCAHLGIPKWLSIQFRKLLTIK
jgi:hypothetical protein